MFGRKKKKQAHFSTVDDTREVAYDFRRRFIYEQYRPTDYSMYYKLKETYMKQMLDKYLDALFAGEVDDGNGDVMDNIILGAVREAQSDLQIQRSDHNDMLRRLIARRNADRKDFCRMTEEYKHKLELLEKSYEKTCIMAANEGKAVADTTEYSKEV